MNYENTEIKDLVCSFEHLYEALHKCKHNVLWKDSVAGFVKNGLVNCYKLKQQLEDDTYTIDPYTMFTIYEPKKREIVSTRIKDRVFQRSLCDNYLYPTITKSFIYDNCACQIGKGTIFARDRLKCHLQRHYRQYGLNGYTLKCDISNYFGSTPHRVAIEAVDKRVPDEWVVDKVAQIVRSFNQGADPNIGMGLGSQVTQIIQLAVLDDLDHFIKEQLRIKRYERYMDDFISIHIDKLFLKDVLCQIDDKLSGLGLALSPKKTYIAPISQPIHFLGFSFRLTDTGKVVCKVLPENISHERRKLTKLAQRVRGGKMTKAEVDKCYISYKAHISYGDCHNLILEMDKFYKNLWR